MKPQRSIAPRRLLLSGYASKQCPRRVHNQYDPTVPAAPDWTPPPELQTRLDAGIVFENEVFAALTAALGDAFVLINDSQSESDRIAGTLAAIRRGTPGILAGQLPNDHHGRRVGKPDILLRWPDGTGYVPADVKHHRMTRVARTKSVFAAPLADPTSRVPVDGRSVEVAGRYDDYIQLAHYTRMLEAAGLHPGPDALTGAIIGSDELTLPGSTGPAFVWLDLATPLFTTFSRSAGRRRRSALERYDHEHAFRVRVAETALRRTGAADDPEPLVAPIWQPECLACSWASYCADQLGADAASTAITAGQLDVREWVTLRGLGVETTTALAEVEPDDSDLQARYLPHVTHRMDALDRLRAAIHRSQLLRDGIALERTTTGPLDVAAADVEIDLDIEWDTDDRVYLWGARVHDDSGTAYRAFVSWKKLTEDTERHLAGQFAAWLRDTIAAARAGGRTVRVYHYSTPEPRYLTRILGEDNVRDLTDTFEDLLPFLRRHFFAVHGLSIKKVAPALGFHWRDDDPGGLQSQGWLQAARTAADPAERQAARDRLLAYNEDDVTATAAIRRALRHLDAHGVTRI